MHASAVTVAGAGGLSHLVVYTDGAHYAASASVVLRAVGVCFRPGVPLRAVESGKLRLLVATGKTGLFL